MSYLSSSRSTEWTVEYLLWHLPQTPPTLLHGSLCQHLHQCLVDRRMHTFLKEACQQQISFQWRSRSAKVVLKVLVVCLGTKVTLRMTKIFKLLNAKVVSTAIILDVVDKISRLPVRWPGSDLFVSWPCSSLQSLPSPLYISFLSFSFLFFSFLFS